MTALERIDGASADSGASSYLDIAAFLIREGSRPDADLEELWNRIVFGMLVSNTDDRFSSGEPCARNSAHSSLVGGHFNCGVMRAFPFPFQVDEEVGVNQTLVFSQCCGPLFKWLGSRQKEVPSGSVTSPSHRAKCLHAFP